MSSPPFAHSAWDLNQGQVVWPSWQGTLLEGKRDRSGFDYRRARVYDPQTGRFTQEDPIGLAGGLNAYGFAESDPVNFSDPFGLCEPWPECASGALASPGFLDPVLLIAGGIAGGARALFGRVQPLGKRPMVWASSIDASTQRPVKCTSGAQRTKRPS